MAHDSDSVMSGMYMCSGVQKQGRHVLNLLLDSFQFSAL